ncbi:TetR/AcrR family transcriptional regulator [Catalinimonas alkaloidigena]|uniref:TetR/AcrR family transcriptional regulator n=1 Tax=Catalinimonas alkaloidigena TaxID=1075417 RepID=UPI002406090C|nr:TetR/AcrR family transcriptional regulator [Catalinimonas alkaloidigena]MDF9798281.1 TetR/AcrR family transcriptional regulator [Catalinimonas alkaloidigena]
MTQDFNTEEKILDAAEQVFQRKGFNGARMQEIADRAEINKGLLHYYFKTKDKLFEAVFSKAFDLMVNRLNAIISTQHTLDDKIDKMVDTYMNMLIKHPHLPLFVINELNRHPDEFINKVLTKKRRPNVQALLDAIQHEIEHGNIRPFPPKQLIINIIGLCIFPFVARPMIQVLLDADNPEFQKMIEERKTLIADFVKSALRP